MTGADLFAELQSSLGATYTFDRELGGGGMARVFLAHERGLGRPVVIKILNPDLAMESSNPRPWFTDAQRAGVRLAIGDSAGALNALEQSARTSGGLWEAMLSPADAAYDPVRHTARFAALMRQAGLDVEAFNALRAKQPR